MCKAKLKNVMNTAYRAFWTFNGTYSKTWGSEIKGGELDLYHDDQTQIVPCFHSLKIKGQIQCQHNGSQ
jgi:hypothetical protein